MAFFRAVSIEDDEVNIAELSIDDDEVNIAALSIDDDEVNIAALSLGNDEVKGATLGIGKDKVRIKTLGLKDRKKEILDIVLTPSGYACLAMEEQGDVFGRMSRSDLEDVNRKLQAATESFFREYAEEPEKLHLRELEKQGPEFRAVVKHVMNSRKAAHGWRPRITKIEEIINPELERRYRGAQKKLIGSGAPTLMYHGTDAVEAISKGGFKLPQNRGMFGKGIYLAPNASKGAQPIYTKGSNKLLLCQFMPGKPLKLETGQKRLTGRKLRQRGFDSVYAPEGTKSTGGVYNDEFVTFNPDQVLPRYIIHYGEE